MIWKNACSSDQNLLKLIKHLLKANPYLIESVFEPKQPRCLYNEEELLVALSGMSTGEKIMIRLAYDFWNETGNVFVWEILESLDKENLINFLNTIYFYRFDLKSKELDLLFMKN